jgi:hypothetical protein
LDELSILLVAELQYEADILYPSPGVDAAGEPMATYLSACIEFEKDVMSELGILPDRPRSMPPKD